MKNNQGVCTCLSCMAFKVLQVPFFPSNYSGIDQITTVANLGIDSDRLQVPAWVLSQFVMHHLGNESLAIELLELVIKVFTDYPVTSNSILAFERQCAQEARYISRHGIRPTAPGHWDTTEQDQATAAVTSSFNGNSRLGADLTAILEGFNPVQHSKPARKVERAPGNEGCDCEACQAARPALEAAIKDGSAGEMVLIFPRREMPLNQVANIIKKVFTEFPDLKPKDF